MIIVQKTYFAQNRGPYSLTHCRKRYIYNMHVHKYVYIHIYIKKHIDTYIYIYIHIHTCTSSGKVGIRKDC